MASVILPTIRWTPGAEDILAGLRDGDELLVICDHETDPVASDAPACAEIVVAGTPQGCSGKANALAAGMERASHDVVVWTDDDVRREPGWLDRLAGRASQHGVATEVPVFVGGGVWSLLEPAFVVFGTLGVAYGGHVWGGGVAFDRTTIDEAEFLADLRRTLGDDSLLSTYVDTPWVERTHLREVVVPGDPRSVYHRITRFAKAAFFFEPASTLGLLAVATAFALASVVAPAVCGPLATAVGAIVYWKIGLRRWTLLLAFPSFVAVPLLLLVGLLAPTFRWGGRRYRWRGRFDVTVLE